IEASLRTDGEARDLLRDIFARYGFKTWLREVESAPAEGGGADAPEGDPAPVIAADIVREYDTIQTWAQFDAWFAKIDAAALTAFDTETTALDPMTARLVGLSFSIEPG